MTTALLEAVIDRVISKEGGYVNHPNDRGGPTKFGLTLKFLLEVTGRPWTVEELKQMSVERARSVYKLWCQMRRLDQLPEHPRLAFNVIDFAVHSGARAAIRAIQKYLGIPSDGIAGAETQGAWHRLSPEGCEQARLEVVASRSELMGHALMQPGQSDFAQGWLNRLAEQIRG